MKENIKRIKTFICFYLSLPLFVFMVLCSGIKALGEMPLPKHSADASYNIEEELPLPSFDIGSEAPNPDGTYPIVARDLSKEYNILNSTKAEINEEELLELPLVHTDKPTVLVVHTHGTECYSEASNSFASADINGHYGFYTKSTPTRTTDTSKNVVAVGEAFCDALAEHGIQSIQCRIMHDKDDYNSAYSNSRETIKKYLEKYPTIKYVIDLHRDSLGENGGEKIKPLASEIDNCAQVMLVAGCHGNGVIYNKWEENLSLALKFKKAMDTRYPTLSRPIYLRYSRYNLDLTSGSLLLEVGSCANTLEEAINAAKLAAECFALMLDSE